MPKRPFCLGLNVLNKMFKVVSWYIDDIIHDVKYNALLNNVVKINPSLSALALGPGDAIRR